MKNSGSAKVWWIVIILIVIGGIWWYSSQSTTLTAPSVPAAVSTSTEPMPAASSTAVATSSQKTIVLNTAKSSALGTYLVATNGMTLYKYAKDASGVSNCSGGCATAWPPYTTSATSLGAGAGITGTLSTIVRADGTKQVTYNGMPLYFWQGDAKTTDATGQNIGGFTVVKP
jgi:predicted lipoprotein with Yx(FWY)xxD motif